MMMGMMINIMLHSGMHVDSPIVLGFVALLLPGGGLLRFAILGPSLSTFKR